jgi:hypothetical protein
MGSRSLKRCVKKGFGTMKSCALYVVVVVAVAAVGVAAMVVVKFAVAARTVVAGTQMNLPRLTVFFVCMPPKDCTLLFV